MDAPTSPERFRNALMAAFAEQGAGALDAWVDAAFGLGAVTGDGAELPRGCVPYLPCSSVLVLQAISVANIGPRDVFVDVGSGVGRVLALVNLLTGAQTLGVEIQAELVHAAQAFAMRLALSAVQTVHGDAIERIGALPHETVYFLYCPFSGERLEGVLEVLRAVAEVRPIRVCAVQLPSLTRDWLEPLPGSGAELVVYRSRRPRHLVHRS